MKIGYQDGAVDDVNLQDPWKHLRWSMGLHLLENGDAVLDNGVANADKAGKVYIRSLEVDGQPMMAPGLHLVPPRALLPIRKSGYRHDVVDDSHLPERRQAWEDAAASKANRIAGAVSRGVRDVSLGFPFDAMGPWFPAGDEGDPGMQAGAVSGVGIEPLPGWERSSELRLLRADHIMHRMGIAYTDVATGKPLTTLQQPVYRLTRGMAAWTQLAQFVELIPGLSPYNDKRRAKACNTGSCPYEATMLYDDPYHGAIPYNDEHLIRGYRDALAGVAVYRDPLCRFYLDRIAADTALVWGQVHQPTDHQGLTWAGRDCGWALHVLKAARHPAAKPLDRVLRSARMDQSVHQRRAWPGPGQSWGYAPDPWNSSPPYLAHDQQGTQSIEVAIVGNACSEPAEVAIALTTYGNPSHYLDVMPGRAPKLDMRQATERESFNVWFAWGRGILSGSPEQRQTLLGRIPSMRLPDDPKQYSDVTSLLDGMYANSHTEQLATAIKALEES